MNRPFKQRLRVKNLNVLNDDNSAPLLDHLEELRARIIVIILSLLIAFGFCYWQIDWIFARLAAPLDDRWPLQTFDVTEPFFMSLSVAAQAAFVLILPIIAWNAWRFVRPAIAPETRRMVGILLLCAPLMFVGGVMFAYFLVLGPAIRVLLGLGPDAITVIVRASTYYSFVTMTLMAIGLAFCFPLALLGTARVGLITSEMLAKNRRFAIVGIAVLAALLPTMDPISLVLEIVPLLALYELSIIAVRIQERRLAKKLSADPSPDVSAINQPLIENTASPKKETKETIDA